MTHTVTNIECNDCKEKFNGVLHDVFYTEKQYFVECPKCNGHNFFYGNTGLVDSEIPTDAVKINYVAKL